MSSEFSSGVFWKEYCPTQYYYGLSLMIDVNNSFVLQVFNNLILGSQDALVSGYPRVPNTERNNFVRYELDYVL